MKKLLIAALACISLNAQAQSLPTYAEDHTDHTAPEYKPGELLVKFKDGKTIRKRRLPGKRLSVGLSRVDSVLNVLGAQDMEALMPLTGARVNRVKRYAYNGKEVKDHDMSRLYRLEYGSGASVYNAAKALGELEDVEFAEPNYIVWAIESDSESALPLKPNDPLLTEQWWLSAIHMQKAWAQPAINSKRPVIAILDTGVDITHPDLKDNIWTNEAETENGYDTDRNGFVDDLHGWDFINQTSKIGDYNGHGTHCAGIAAATGNNGRGVVGANPDARIMPITVLQSNGSGDVATIIKGIDYAAANGADVISMSFGSYAYSIAQDQAFSKAYSKCFLVAAAGNDGRCVNAEGGICPYCGKPAAICFPAAFTYVLGVQAANAGFSNVDCNGPIYSPYDEEKLYNYEVSAPGIEIYSTYPGGKYRRMSGTSMACPMVAGVASRVLQTKDILSYEILFGDFIHSTSPLGGRIDLDKLYEMSDEDRKPTIHLVTMELTDSLGDKDGRVDAGEIIDLYPTVRNDWGNADDVTLTVEFAENEDKTLCEFLTNNVPLGCSLSSYAKAKAQTPIRIKMRDDIVDGRIVRLKLKAKCTNMSSDYEPDEFAFKVENGIELGGTQRENITLYPGVQYIVTRNWGIPKDVVVTVKAGTTLKIKDGVGISNYGHMLFEGTRDSMITITKGDNDLGEIGYFLNDNANYCDFNYVVFENLRNIDFHGHRYKNCVIRDCIVIDHLGVKVGYFSRNGSFKNCDIYNNVVTGHKYDYLSENATFLNTDIHDNNLKNGFGTCSRFYQNNYIGNRIKESISSISSPDVRALEASNCFGNYYDILAGYYSVVFLTTEPEIFYLSDAYLGTASDKEAYKSILDSEDNMGWGTVDVQQKRNNAVEEAPACVDYVKVDGKNPLDDADELPPLGVGRHLVEVGFNRVMNQKVHPMVSMGVRPPYTQKSISEDGFWFDPYTYRAYITIDGRSATDGTNRIRVSGYQAKDINPNFRPHTESYRYNVLVSAAGSMSTGLMAEAGLGKVKLEWQTDMEDFADLMGYNIYRYTYNEDGTCGDTIKVNDMTVLAEDTTYTDFDVIPGTTYCYYIKEIGTDLVENSVSSTIAVTPLTAQKGDANGSMQVDIADVMTEIAYLSNENPQPFIYEAADVNSDNNVDILDVVGTIRMITAPEVSAENTDENAIAYYYVKNGRLYVETPVVLGGIQVRLESNEKATANPCEDLEGMELLNAQVSEKSNIFLAYSMTGKVVGMGAKALLDIPEGAEVTEVVLSTPRGANVKAIARDATGIANIENKKPTHLQGIYDLYGRKLNALPKHGVVIDNGKKIVR